MTALTKDRKTVQFDSAGGVIPRAMAFPMAAAAKIYGASMVGVDASGNSVPASAIATLKIPGVCAEQKDNTAGAAGDLSVTVETGVFTMDNGTGPDALSAADLYNTCYAADDHTVTRDDGGGTRPAAGVFLGLRASDSKPYVSFGLPASALLSTGASSPSSSPSNFGRVVATAIDAYDGTGTDTITKSSNGALGAQDSVTLAVGDEFFIPPGIANVTAADSGPWVLAALGASGAKWSAKRPTWWKTGDGIRQGHVIQIGGEGTLFRGMSLKTFCAKGKIIGTDDPLFVPATQLFRVTLASGTYTLGAGGGGEALWLRDTTKCAVEITSDTHAGTLGTNRLEAPSGSRTAGVPGTAAIVINSLIDAGTVAGSDSSTLDVSVKCW